MAKKPPPKTAPAAPEKKKSGKMGLVTFMLVLGFAAPFMMPTLMVVIAGFIPTYIALMTDSDPQKSGAVSVGWMNGAGLTPFVIDLLFKGQTMENAVHILGSANTWLVILGTSFVGQLIVYTIPQAIATMTLSHAESRVKALRKNMDMLKNAWGAEVATTKPLDKVVQE